MKPWKRLLVVLVGAVVALILVWWLRRLTTPPGVQQVQCDSSLWQHVYHPRRLHVIQACMTVEGTVESVQAEADGDYHIRLNVDDNSLLNETNLRRQHGNLVIETICMNPVSQADAVEACRGFAQNVPVPSRGERVRVTGAFVTDLDHGWNEIHPVTSVEILR